MSFDARDMVDVNQALIQEAAAQAAEGERFVVVSVASWGRGVSPEVLQQLESRRHGLGFNGSVVARIPVDEAGELFDCAPLLEQEPPGPDRYPVLGVAFKERHLDWF